MPIEHKVEEVTADFLVEAQRDILAFKRERSEHYALSVTVMFVAACALSALMAWLGFHWATCLSAASLSIPVIGIVSITYDSTDTCLIVKLR